MCKEKRKIRIISPPILICAQLFLLLVGIYYLTKGSMFFGIFITIVNAFGLGLNISNLNK